MSTNFVLVDYENVQPKNISLPKGGSFKIKVFLGANQAKIPVEIANALQAHGADAEYIKIDGNGSNALDFHIAYYIGRLAAENPGAYFHVISKDTGFDPLIKHLKSQKILCRRLASLADILPIKASSPKSPADSPLTKASKPKSVSDKVNAVIIDLKKRKEAKPRTIKALRNTMNALFANKLTGDELDKLVGQLSERGTIKVTDDKVSYALA